MQRRGSEASRLLLSAGKDCHSWIDRSQLSKSDKELQSRYSVAFVMGKGDQRLPVFFPARCEAVLEMLADSAIRERVGVSMSNNFLFAYTDASSDGAVGYNDMRHKNYVAQCRRTLM